MRLKEMMATAFAATANEEDSITVDLSCISEILDICSASARDHPAGVSTATSNDIQAPQWTRLSRRPSVDHPDDDGSPVPAQTIDVFEPQPAPSTPAEELSRSLHADATQMTSDESAAPAGHLEFPAHLFFAGISQDESNWWSSFDSYDPDWSNF